MIDRLCVMWLLVLWPAVASCSDKDFIPPPLNPHPKQALYVTVTFDNPEDAKHYRIEMKALYQNQQYECGFIDPLRGGSFIHPEEIVIFKNESNNPTELKYSIYIDRYNSQTCNWELAKPYFLVQNIFTKIWATNDWGTRQDILPGSTYSLSCLFQSSDFPQVCYGRHPMPEKKGHRVPIHVRVSSKSSHLHKKPKSFFRSENFVKPVTEEQ
ncbi:hypothetical protein P3W24_12440 [Luteibacter sp. PPL201]|uniref:Uncharacterized protein n=1 Tax=Luteibacter sahnii TaxID=3021977 RepID=A0ABT6BCB6_9GAMM